jgi:hypothetical protein
MQNSVTDPRLWRSPPPNCTDLNTILPFGRRYELVTDSLRIVHDGLGLGTKSYN